MRGRGAPERFVFLTDLHWGYERVGGALRPLHDLPLLERVLRFVGDFKPHHVILGGDMLDCGAVSHHNKGFPGRTEGLKLVRDAEGLRKALLRPLEALRGAKLTYMTGNHERFLTDFLEEQPGLEGLLTVQQLLRLGPRWTVVPQGGLARLGKLYFAHGDQLNGGEHMAKAAVIAYERNLRFGHIHTYSAYTKNSACDLTDVKSAVSVPCLCRKGPGYGRGSANRWTEGFLWGYVFPDGTFTDYVTVAIKGRFVANGKVYS